MLHVEGPQFTESGRAFENALRQAGCWTIFCRYWESLKLKQKMTGKDAYWKARADFGHSSNAINAIRSAMMGEGYQSSPPT